MNQEGIWLSIVEYANVKKTSISTIRRSIKSGHVQFKEENGKYFILAKAVKQDSLKEEKEQLSNKLELEFLKRRNRELQEEINDLKMLLSVYENNSQEELPPIPQSII